MSVFRFGTTVIFLESLGSLTNMLDVGLSTLVELRFNLSEPEELGFTTIVFFLLKAAAAYFPFFDGLEPVLGTYIDDAFFKPSGNF